MVVKIKMGKSIRGILIYNENKVEKEQANLILASGFAVDIDRLNLIQKINRFSKLTGLNERVKTNAMHISLNFDASDKLDTVKLQQIALTYMEQIGYSDQPYIVYEHLDAAHPHLHIATTIIQKDAKRKFTHEIGRLVSEPARKVIEKQFGLIKAEGRSQGQALKVIPAVYGERPTKQTINSILLAVIKNYSFTSLAEFNAILMQFNIKADRGSEDTMMFQKKGLLYSTIDEKGQSVGVLIKASKFYSQPTLANLEKRFMLGAEQRKSLKEGLRHRIDRVLAKFEFVSKAILLSELAKAEIALVFRQNEKGLIYGVTYVDHQQRTVFNGSDLGKAYSAKVITEKLSHQDKLKTYLVPKLKTNYLEHTVVNRSSLNSAFSNPFEPLLEKIAYDEPTVIGKKRKKKKGKSTNQNL
jgi:hypothetical protein